MMLSEGRDLYQRHHKSSGIMELDFNKVKMASSLVSYWMKSFQIAKGGNGRHSEAAWYYSRHLPID